MKGFLFVGLGGALGAVLRYAISLFPYKGTFPVLTFITNVLGALLIGYIARGSRAPGTFPESGSISENRSVRRIYYLFHVFSGSIQSV